MPVQRYRYVVTIDAESGEDADAAMDDMVPFGLAVRQGYSYRVVNWTAHGEPTESPNLKIDGREENDE